MPLSLTLSNLASRTTRIAAAGNAGVRRLAINATTSQEEEDGIVSIYNVLNRFGQSLVRGTLSVVGQFLSFSWSKIWSLTVSAGLFLINFNWNITDTTLDDQIKQAEIGLAAVRGSLVGQSLGYAICGVIPTATIAVFNEPLALYIMQELGEEAAEEIAESLNTLLLLQLRQQVQRGFAAFFKNYRTLLRGAAIGFAQTLVSVGILTQESVERANKNRNEPWTLAGALENTIESIKDPAEQAYVEEFWDEFQDACIEAGFIIAGAADAYFAQARLANSSILGDERIIEIQPIRIESEL